jgi:hypothetical protein
MQWACGELLLLRRRAGGWPHAVQGDDALAVFCTVIVNAACEVGDQGARRQGGGVCGVKLRPSADPPRAL